MICQRTSRYYHYSCDCGYDNLICIVECGWCQNKHPMHKCPKCNAATQHYLTNDNGEIVARGSETSMEAYQAACPDLQLQIHHFD